MIEAEWRMLTYAEGSFEGYQGVKVLKPPGAIEVALEVVSGPSELETTLGSPCIGGL